MDTQRTTRLTSNMVMWATLGVVVVIAVVGGWYELSRSGVGSASNVNIVTDQVASSNVNIQVTVNTKIQLTQKYTGTGFTLSYPDDWKIIQEHKTSPSLTPKDTTFMLEGSEVYPITIGTDKKNAEEYLSDIPAANKALISINGQYGYSARTVYTEQPMYVFSLANKKGSVVIGYLGNIAEQTGGTKVYEASQREVFEAVAHSLQIPAGTLLPENLQTYTDSVQGFSLQYPKDWQTSKGGGYDVKFGPKDKTYFSRYGDDIAPLYVSISEVGITRALPTSSRYITTPITLNGYAGYRVVYAGEPFYEYYFPLPNGYTVSMRLDLMSLKSTDPDFISVLETMAHTLNIKDKPAPDPFTKTYTNTEEGFTVQYPTGWNIDYQGSSLIGIVFYKGDPIPKSNCFIIIRARDSFISGWMLNEGTSETVQFLGAETTKWVMEYPKDGNYDFQFTFPFKGNKYGMMGFGKHSDLECKSGQDKIINSFKAI